MSLWGNQLRTSTFGGRLRMRSSSNFHTTRCFSAPNTFSMMDSFSGGMSAERRSSGRRLGGLMCKPPTCTKPGTLARVEVRFLIELFRKQQIELRLIVAQKLHHIVPSERILGRLKAQRIQKVHQHLVHRDVEL
uniref:Uncharacterized protein n=1 Tax=Anopheles merus TaxID=30066 RepID=A0A182VJG8_ANOME